MDKTEDEESLSTALGTQLNQSPWYVMSTGVHALILLFLLLIPVPSRAEPQRQIRVEINIIEPPIEDKIIESEPEIQEIQTPITTPETTNFVSEVQVQTHDIQIADTIETDDSMDQNTALGDPENISDVDSEYMGTPAIMGLHASGGGGGGGKFGNRTGGGKRNSIRIGGGGPNTENAVNWALQWLAEHQEVDGRWDCAKYGGGGHDVAVTSLALLAFLGAGNSNKFGKYRNNVARAIDWMLKAQDAEGRMGPHRYEAGIAVMALAEAYGMSNESHLREAAQRAVNYATKSQCPAGGWDYAPTSQRNDTSVAGWWIMGLKSAKVAGLSIPNNTMEKALKYTQQVTDNSGSVSYSSNGGTVEQMKKGGGSIRLTAVSLTCLQFLGKDRDDVQVKGCAEKSHTVAPDPSRFDFYLWYYQALGLFQMGVKSPYWTRFNEPMKNALLTTQVKEGTFQQNKGSWNPEGDHHGKNWGRVGQTALGALMLEIYYRYHEVH